MLTRLGTNTAAACWQRELVVGSWFLVLGYQLLVLGCWFVILKKSVNSTNEKRRTKNQELITDNQTTFVGVQRIERLLYADFHGKNSF